MDVAERQSIFELDLLFNRLLECPKTAPGKLYPFTLERPLLLEREDEMD